MATGPTRHCFLATATASRISSSILSSDPASPASFILSNTTSTSCPRSFGSSCAHELLEHLLFAGHRLGTDDVRPGDPGAILLEPHLLIGPLAPQPEGEGGDLGAAEVDVDAVQVVPQDQAGQSPSQVVLRGVVRLQRRSQVGVVVGFLVDDQQQGEAVEQEVPAAARRVEDLDLSGVFLGRWGM